MKRLTKEQKVKIANEAVNAVLPQFRDANNKTELIGMVSDARKDFIDGGYENFGVEHDKDIRSIALLQTKILKRKFQLYGGEVSRR